MGTVAVHLCADPESPPTEVFPGEIADMFPGAVCRLRALPGSEGVSRELWIYSRRFVWRFFRVGDTDLVELCSDGESVPDKKDDAEVP